MLQTIYLFHYEKLGTLNYFNWVGARGHWVGGKGGGLLGGRGQGRRGKRPGGGGGGGGHTYPLAMRGQSALQGFYPFSRGG